MKLLRSLTLTTILGTAALAGTAFAEPAAAPAPAPKKAADAKAPAPAPAPAPAKKPEISQADADKFIAFFNKFVDAVVAAKEDCTKMAASINTLIDKNQPLIKMANDAKAAGKDLPQAAKDKMMGRVKEMMPAMQKCGADPGVQTAMKRMEDGGKAGAKAPPAKTSSSAPAPTKTAPATGSGSAAKK
ncbi:MAG: hypothetical protein H0T89_13495 [Deltaproteobacteria bacterium]|nr:hypothetical protein [Deltaproteobacteria bacterium]MDQ3295453.1 hypothetical protein [Myxococcota bacterium]